MGRRRATLALAALAAAGLLCADSAAATPEIEERISGALLGHGFESVSAGLAGDTLTVWFENRVYRYEMTALGVVALLAAPEVEPSAVLVLVPVTRGVPNVAISARAGDWDAFVRADSSSAWFRERVVIRPGPHAAAASESRPRRSEENPSRWKVDLAARPLLEFQFGAVTDPFQFGFWIAPEATVSPFRGGQLTVQAKVRVTDEFDSHSRAVAPGRTTLSVAGWLPGDWLGAASAGHFADERYGLAAEMSRFLGDGSFEVRFGGDISGFIRFAEEETRYSAIEKWSSVAAVTYRTRGRDIETTLSGGRYYEGDAGARLDIVRRWGESEVGLFGIKTESGTVGGMRISVPLPVRRLGAPSRLRFVTVPYFPWEYRESSEPAGLQVRLFDNTARFRKGLLPTVVKNNIEALRTARRYVASGGGGGE